MTADSPTVSGADRTPVVSMVNITKAFGSNVAVREASFTLHAGEIHALLGENGAGKTTLMNILFGLVHPDAGEIRIRREQVAFSSAKDALERRIGMVHQHFMLVPDFTVAENVVLGTRPLTKVRLNRAQIEAEVAATCERYRMSISPSARLGDLSIDVQQRVEILKLLYRGAEVLILDEPTAVLGPTEVAHLFETLRELRSRGHAVVIITHKLGEVMEIADRVTVLRAGSVVTTADAKELDEHGLATAMIGHDLPELPHRDASHRTAEAVLEVRDLTVRGDHDHVSVENVTFEIHGGEIVGLVGVEGNGQVELVETLSGVRTPERGSICVNERELAGAKPADFYDAGVAIVTEDRLTWDLVGDLSLAENIALAAVRTGRYSRLGILNRRRMERDARRLLEQYRVRPCDPRARASTLSGGNQQKVVMARELSRDPAVLIASQPTRGLDVGASDFVYREISRLRDQGCAVLLNANDLDEVMTIADRIIVFYRGRVALQRATAELTVSEVAAAMTGASTAGVAA